MDGLMSHSLWVEKYRPKDLSTYIGNEHLKSKVKVYLESEDVPHLLLYGRAGTGKTTLANPSVETSSTADEHSRFATNTSLKRLALNVIGFSKPLFVTSTGILTRFVLVLSLKVRVL